MRQWVRMVMVLCLMSMACVATAQEADSAGWHYGVNTGMTVSNWGRGARGLSWVAPSAMYSDGERLTVGGGFVMAGSLMPAGYDGVGRSRRSLAPRSEGSEAAAVWAAASYRVSDKMVVWGAVAHATGWVQPLWGDHSQPLSATAVSGGMLYELSDKSLLEMHFHIVSDKYGSLTMPGGLIDQAWYGAGGCMMEMRHSPWVF